MDKKAYKKAKEALKAGDYKAAEQAFKITLNSVHQHIGLANDGQYNINQKCQNRGLLPVVSLRNKHYHLKY